MSFPRYPEYKDSGVEWLGEVPAHWGVRTFRRCVDVEEGQVNPEVPPYDQMVLIAPNHVESGTGRILATETAAEQGAESGKYLCRTGDVVYSKIRPGLRKACLAPQDCLCSADMYPLRAHSGLENRYLLWFILSECFSAWAVLESQRVAMPKINRESLAEVNVTFPPLGEQVQITAFLDHETAKIDALIAEQEKLIELLREKRQAVISHAVTKGLDPNVPMKDSGVGWLGEVPAHWRVVPLGRVTTARCDGPFGSAIKSDHYTDEGARVVRLQNIRFGAFDQGDDAFIDLAYFVSELQGHSVEGGDVLIAGLGDDNNVVGRACVAPTNLGPALVKADCFRFRLDCEQAVPAFVALQLSAGALAEGARLATGTTRQRIPLSSTSARRLVMPSTQEQRTIVAFLDHETTKIDALIATVHGAVDNLSERRAALISAAVTGQIDVRAAASSSMSLPLSATA